MGLEDAIADFLCQTYKPRGSRRIDKGINEWEWAETAAYVQFAKDFKRRHGGGIVLGQLDYHKISTPTDPATQFILDAMQVYFRNWWSKRNASNAGGFRKPDGLGISPGGRIIEIIEVKPHQNYADGVQQLNEMIKIIKDGLQSYYQEESTRRMVSVGPDPANFTTVKGSPWKPSSEGMEMPLIDPSGQEISWICFRPTLRQSGAVDGVILYEIHTIEKNKYQQKVPESIAKRLREAYERQKHAANWNPFAHEYVRMNPEDAKFINAMILTIGVAAVITIVAVAVIAAAPVVAAGAGTVAAEGAVIVETVELVGGSYRVAATATAVATRVAPQIYYRIAQEEEEIVELTTNVVSVAKMKMTGGN